MNDISNKYGLILGVVTLGGFAIQQALQVFDIPISWMLDKITGGGARIPSVMTLSEVKKSAMTALAFVIALIVTCVYPTIGTLRYIDSSFVGKLLDSVVTALVLSAGTEGMNTLLKYFGYVKDARKPPDVEVTIG
jgi:hypothetical protein